MSEEANVSVVNEEVAPPTEAEQHNDVSNEAQEAQQSKRSDAEHNFAELRRARERDREELEQLRREINRIRPPQPQTPEEEDIGIKDDDLAEGRHVRTLKKEIKELRAEMKRRDLSSTEQRLHARYQDIESVLSPENIENAKKLEPELIKGIQAIEDPYEKGVAAYRLVSRLTKENAPSPDKKKVAENTQKPVSVNAITKTSALGNAHLFENGLTPELKSSLWKEMKEAMKAS